MEWLWNLMADHESVAYTVIVYSVVIAIGVALGKVKFFGISFGIAWVLFAGIAMAEMGFTVNTHIQHFIKEFGLILFVYTIGLQVGPGFFSAFKKEGIKLPEWYKEAAPKTKKAKHADKLRKNQPKEEAEGAE